MVIPLMSQQRFLGILNLECSLPDRFNDDNFQFIRLLASRIAVAVDNAQLHQQTRSQLTETQSLYEQVSELETLKSDMIQMASDKE